MLMGKYFIGCVLCLVAQLCLALFPPGSSVHGDSPGKDTGMGCHGLLQGIFPTQGLNPGLLHRRQILFWATREALYKLYILSIISTYHTYILCLLLAVYLKQSVVHVMSSYTLRWLHKNFSFHPEHWGKSIARSKTVAWNFDRETNTQ